MTFRHCLVSDLHLDHPHPKTPPFEEEFIIVAGDTGNGLIGLKYLNKLKRRGHVIFAVDGNHEHYCNESQGRTLNETEVDFYEGLNQERVLDLPEHKLKIVGCNGWYEVRDEEHWLGYMNDGRFGNTSAKEVTEKAFTQANFLYDTIHEMPSDYRAIVVTHTSPHPMSLDPRYIGSHGNQYFFNPYMERVLFGVGKRIAVWYHGHTHRGMDQVIHGVRIVTNPRGYPGENPRWKPKVMEIE